MRMLFLAAALSLAIPAGAETATPAAAPDPVAAAAARDAEMAKVRAVLQQMQAEQKRLSFAPTPDSETDVVAAGPRRAILPSIDDGAPANRPPSAAADDGSQNGRRRRHAAEFKIPINDQLKAMGVDTGPVDVGIGGHGVVLGLKF